VPVTAAEAAAAAAHVIALAAWGVRWRWGRFDDDDDDDDDDDNDGVDTSVSADSCQSHSDSGVQWVTCLHQGSRFVRVRVAYRPLVAGSLPAPGSTSAPASVPVPVSAAQAHCLVVTAVPAVCGAALDPVRDVRELLATLDERTGGGGGPAGALDAGPAASAGSVVEAALRALRQCGAASEVPARAAAVADALSATVMRLRPPAVRRVLNFKACRSAIKFGDPVPVARLAALVKELAQCGNPFACAHGRPTGAPVAVLKQELWWDGTP
jgi:hypothetical protein